MPYPLRGPRRKALRVVALLLAAIASSPAAAQRKPKLPKPEIMENGVVLGRDPATGELRYRRGTPNTNRPETEAGSAFVLRSQVRLVEVQCNVVAPDGAELRGLRREDFRVFQDGVAQRIEHFDASTEAASLALIFDASPSVTRDLAEMKRAARALAAGLAPADEVAVVTAERSSYLLLPFTRNRELLLKAIERIEIERDPSKPAESNVYRAVYLGAQQLFAGRRGRKAIILLTDGQDSGMGLGWNTRNPTAAGANRLHFEDVARALSAGGVEVAAISTQSRPKVMTDEWLGARQGTPLVSESTRDAGVPHYTAYMAELVRLAGGRLFFLRESPTLSDVYRQIAERLRTQYTLGIYAAPGDGRWHSLRVELPARSGMQIRHRVAYYAAAEGGAGRK